MHIWGAAPLASLEGDGRVSVRGHGGGLVAHELLSRLWVLLPPAADGARAVGATATKPRALRTVDVDEDLGESDVRVGAGTTPRRGRRKSRGKSSVSGDSDSAAAAAAAACGGGSSANEDSALRIKLPSFLLGGAIGTAVDSSKQQSTSGERRHDDTNFTFPSISAAGAGGGEAGLMIEIELT